MSLNRDWRDFKSLNGGIAGAREAFENACETLFRKEYEEKHASQVSVNQGDGGIDIFVGELGVEEITVIQCKFFLEAFEDSQKSQIRESFKTAIESEDYDLKEWILCVPRVIDIDENSWWFKWKHKKLGELNKDNNFIKIINGNEIIDLMKSHDLYNTIFQIDDSIKLKEIHEAICGQKQEKELNNVSEKVINRLLKELEEKDKSLEEKNKELNALKDTYEKVIKNTSKDKKDIQINSLIVNAEFEKAEELLLNRLDNQNKNTAQTYFTLGDISSLRNNYSDAINYYIKGLELDKNEYYQVQLVEVYGRVHMYDYKIDILHELLNENKDSNMTHYWEGYLGSTYNEIADDKKAIEHLEKAIELYKKDNLSDTKFELMIYRDLSRAYYLNGEYKTSLSHIDTAINIQINYYKEDLYSLADLYIQKSDSYSMLGLFKESKELTSNALDIRKKVFGNDSIAVAMTLVSLARIISWQGNNKEAINISLDALKIYDNQKIKSPLNLSMCYHNIGYYNVQLYNADEAIKYIKKSLDINKKIYTKDNNYIASNYTYLGAAYSIKRDYQTAIDYLKKALSIRKKVLDNNHTDIAATYCNLAGIYMRAEDYDEALLNLNKGYQIYLDKFGENYHSVLTSLLNFGLIYKYKGNKEEAIKNLKDAKNKMKLQTQKDISNIKICCETLAEIYFYDKNFDEAKDNLEELKDLGELEDNTLLGICYASIGFENQSFEYLEKAYKILKDKEGYEKSCKDIQDFLDFKDS